MLGAKFDLVGLVNSTNKTRKEVKETLNIAPEATQEEEGDSISTHQKHYFHGWLIAKVAEENLYVKNNVQDVMEDYNDDLAVIYGEEYVLDIGEEDFQEVIQDVTSQIEARGSLGDDGEGEGDSEDGVDHGDDEDLDGEEEETQEEII